MKPTIMLLILPLLTGCLTTAGDRAASALAVGANLYCYQPEAIRAAWRTGINSRMDPGNRIVMFCERHSW